MKVLITGARSGIAYATFNKLIKRGHEVILCVHTKNQENSLKEKVKIYGDRVQVYKLDITNKHDLELLSTLSYDVLWAHAGVGYGGSLLAMDIDVLRNNYEVNVFGTMEVVKRGYNNFCNNKKIGKIFVTSSLTSMLVLPYLSCYTSSKAALSILVKTLNIELKKINKNITISLIEPGAYKTGFNEVMIDNKDKFLENRYEQIKESIKDIIRNKGNTHLIIEEIRNLYIDFDKDKELIKENKKDAYAYVDGSYNQSTNTYGYGGFIKYNSKIEKFSGSGNDKEMALMRNVAGEILGSMAAIERAVELKLPSIDIYYDYMGIEKWAIGEWKRNKKGTIAYYNYIQSVKDKLVINFIKVKGHSGVEGNEEADKLAKLAVGINE